MVQDIIEMKQELVVFLRNSDIISTSNRGVTTSSDTGTYTAAVSDTLNTNPTLVKNVRSIVVGGLTLTRYVDYTVNYSTGVITYTTAKTGAFTLSYDTGTTDSIFPDFPQANAKLSSFPRIAVDIIGGNGSVVDLGASTTHYSYNFTVVAYSKGTQELEDMIKNIIYQIASNRKNFYYLKYIGNDTLGPVLNSPGKGDKVLQRNVDFETSLNYSS